MTPPPIKSRRIGDPGSGLQPETWGDEQIVGIKNDWALLSEDELRRRTDELITMIDEIRNPPPGPPPLVYRWEEALEEAQPCGIVWQPLSITSRKGG